MSGTYEEDILGKEFRELKDLILSMDAKLDSMAQQAEENQNCFKKFMEEIREAGGRNQKSEENHMHLPRISPKFEDSSGRHQKSEEYRPNLTAKQVCQKLGFCEEEEEEEKLDRPCVFYVEQDTRRPALKEETLLIGAEKQENMKLGFREQCFESRKSRNDAKSWKQLNLGMLIVKWSDGVVSNEEVLQCEKYRRIMQALLQGNGDFPEYKLEGGTLFYINIRVEVKLIKPRLLNQLLVLVQYIESQNLALLEET